MDATDTLEPTSMERPAARESIPRKRGRPLEMSPAELLRLIQDKSREGALFRVHREHPALYARARRLFGSWARALTAAGVDHGRALAEARRRALDTRRRASQAGSR